VIEGVDLLATSHDAAGLLEAFATLPFVAERLDAGPAAARVRLEDGVEVSLAVATEDAFAGALLASTGPAAHVAELEARGLRARAAYRDEADAYAAAGLPWIPPERRHLPLEEAPVEDLVEMADVQGVGPLHGAAGAGSFTAASLADRAGAEGYAWAALAERVPARPGASDPEDGVPRAKALHALVAAVLEDGSLGADDAALGEADLVIAELAPEEAGSAAALARRLVRAVSGGRVDVLACPTGRIALGRAARAVDLGPVLDACAAAGTAVLVSGLPEVLPDPAWLAGAAERGLLLWPAADAHDLNGVDHAILAVAHARRAGWPRDRVLTTFPEPALRAWVAARRRGR
jgi:hypothetical protein